MVKPNLYDRDICPLLTDSNDRCDGCKWWQPRYAKRIDFVNGELIGKEKTLYEIKHCGCFILDEICPECIYKSDLGLNGLVPADEHGEPLNVGFEYLIPLQKGKKITFVCRKCGKKFEHKDVFHALKIRTLIGIDKIGNKLIDSLNGVDSDKNEKERQ